MLLLNNTDTTKQAKIIIQHNKKVEKIYLQANKKKGNITPKFEVTNTIEDTDT